ncbi:uncharacterized protein [Gorilla gorilla gorilla]|uniref:uncharacterized protein n=1 Tax=Gorilla gorilla gorilla TaxID=9595 RepID=UPI00123EACA7
MAVVAPAAGLGAEILGPRRRAGPASGATRPPRRRVRGSPWRAAGASFPAPAQLLLPAPPPGSCVRPGSAPGGPPPPALAARPAPPAPPVLIQLRGGDAHPPPAFSRDRSSGALPEHPGATCALLSRHGPGAGLAGEGSPRKCLY